VDVLMTATTWRAEGDSLLGYQGIVRDITEQKRAEQERLRLSVVEQELKLATSIQQSLLPPPEPGWADLEVVCYSVPAREVGGDLYAYYQLAASDEESGGETKYAVAVGDVTGKGMPAALLMAVSLASLSSSVRQALPPHKLLAYLDTALVDYTHLSSQNCALVYAEISRPTTADNESGSNSLLRLANAGCPTPMVKRNNGAVEWIEIGGLPLGVGLGAEMGYPEAEVNLAKGDMLILTSDGVVEARDETKELFGFERLYHAVKRAPQISAEAMLEFLKAEVARFVGKTEPHDDLTIVVVRI
jgi:serine phosphatase RsbU (regulator of sigma subunit)